MENGGREGGRDIREVRTTTEKLFYIPASLYLLTTHYLTLMHVCTHSCIHSLFSVENKNLSLQTVRVEYVSFNSKCHSYLQKQLFRT